MGKQMQIRVQTMISLWLLLILASTCALAERPPSWLEGTFRGYNTLYATTVTIRIRSNGDLTTQGRGDNGFQSEEAGYYEGNRLKIGRSWYRLERAARGFWLTEERDSRNRVEYVLIREGDDDRDRDRDRNRDRRRERERERADDTVPVWAVGNFSGYDEERNQSFQVHITRDGRVEQVFWERGRYRDTRTGSWRDGRIEIGRERWRVESRGRDLRVWGLRRGQDMILRRVRDDEERRDDRRDDRRDGDVPDWAVGRFTGYNRKYRVQVTLTIRSNGEVIARGRRDDGNTTEESGHYESGRLIIGGNTYLLDRRRDSFRLTEDRDRGNVTEYTRASR